MKEMKKAAIASVAFAAVLSAVSCQKEIASEQNESGPMTISAVAEGLNTPTKTECAFKYDVLWGANDKICVKNASGNRGIFSLKDGAGTTKGTFKQDDQATFTGEVEAYYPATMIQDDNLVWPASQTNDQTVPMRCKKTLSGTTDEQMDFSSLGSVLQIVFNSLQPDITLKSIKISDGEKTMSGAITIDTDGKANVTATDKAGITLDLGTGVALGKEANYFHIAVPANNYTDLTLIFTATNGATCKFTGGAVDIAHNTVGRLTLTGKKFSIPYGALKGVFTVAGDSYGNIKRVYFSKGNLWADVTKTIHFESAQWKYTPAFNGTETYAIWDEGHVSHFSFSSTVEAATSCSASGNSLFCDENHKQAVDGSEAVYYALSGDEWRYLLTNHPRKWATVNGMPGYVVAPDNFSGTLSDSYADDAALADEDLVFLPAAGYRGYLGINNTYYVHFISNNCAYYGGAADVIFTNDGSISIGSAFHDYQGLCLRLVADAEILVARVESVSLNKSDITIVAGTSRTLTATILPAGAKDKRITWASDDESVATVDNNGKVTAIGPGEATITVTTTDGNFTADCRVTVVQGDLPGVFSVSDDGGATIRKVRFSRGNLTCDISSGTPCWDFYEQQYGCAEYGQASTSLISLFTWGYGASTSLNPTGNDHIYCGKLVCDKRSSEGGNDWGVAYCESNEVAVGTWSTLSDNEWQYLLDGRTVNGGKGKDKSYSLNVIYGGKVGMVFYPDDYDKAPIHGSISNLPEGVVFLPAAGYRDSGSNKYVDYNGYYWSNTSYSSDQYQSSFNLYFRTGEGDVGIERTYGTYGLSVRLVKDVTPLEVTR